MARLGLCTKCGEFYEKMSDGFYFETRRDRWRRPCKQCLSEYNKTPRQKKNRMEANRRYKKTAKGKRAIYRASKAARDRLNSP